MQKSRRPADPADAAIRLPPGTLGRPRPDTLAEVLEIARKLLANAPSGVTAEITACLGEPFCKQSAADRPRTCDHCECLSLDERGMLSWPRSGTA
jgi:hypothetical protein